MNFISFDMDISEYKTQAEDDTDDSGSNQSGGAPSVLEDDGENESAQDLDASMEDLDEDATADTEDNGDGDADDMDDGPSDAS